MLRITIDRRLKEPVYVQVARQIRLLIAAGSLLAGTPLPSVRQLAGDLSVNLNTVARAYRMLEGEGFLDIQKRVGVRVAAPAEQISRSIRDKLLPELRSLLARLKQAGMGSDELLEIIERELMEFQDPGGEG